MIDAIYFEKPKAAELTALRIQARAKRRLTYDCLGAKVVGDKVACSKGYHFPRTGAGLLAVLRGRSLQVCQRCDDYDGEVGE